MSKKFDNFCADHNIVRRDTMHNRPQQNGVAKHFNRVLGKSITTTLLESHLPLQFWREVLVIFIYFYNRYSTSALPGTTPFIRTSAFS